MSSNELVRIDIDENIAILSIDHPPVNALNSDVLNALDKAIDELEKNETIFGVVVTGGGNNAFCAGADIKSFATITDPKDLMAVLSL